MTDDEFVTENIFPQIKAVQKETGIKGKKSLHANSHRSSGEMHGPELPDTIFLLGREKSIQHIENMLKKSLNKKDATMDIWEKMYEEAQKLYNPHEVSDFVYANQCRCCSRSRRWTNIYRILYGGNLWCFPSLRRAGSTL